MNIWQRTPVEIITVEVPRKPTLLWVKSKGSYWHLVVCIIEWTQHWSQEFSPGRTPTTGRTLKPCCNAWGWNERTDGSIGDTVPFITFEGDQPPASQGVICEKCWAIAQLVLTGEPYTFSRDYSKPKEDEEEGE
jgi:hypothetical protein